MLRTPTAPQHVPWAGRDPQRRKCSQLASEPFVLLVSTYGDGDDGVAVPKEVVTFLNVEANRNFIRGVIAAGNTNIGDAFCLVGDIIAAKCRTQLLYEVLLGTPEDVERVRTGLKQF